MSRVVSVSRRGGHVTGTAPWFPEERLWEESGFVSRAVRIVFSLQGDSGFCFLFVCFFKDLIFIFK